MQYRDISVLSFSPYMDVVMASDMSASIGEKAGDQLYAPNSLVGAYAARVVLLELLCIGAEIVTLHYMVGGTYESTVCPVVQGMQQELRLAGLDHVTINGSNEENMSTNSTSVGVTAVGRRKKRPFPSIDRPVALYLVGTPLVGQAVLERPEEMVTYGEVYDLLAYEGVVDIVPVGSRGMGHEIDLMVTACSGQWYSVPHEEHECLWSVSAGPATAVVVAIDQNQQDRFEERFHKWRFLGTIHV